MYDAIMKMAHRDRYYALLEIDIAAMYAGIMVGTVSKELFELWIEARESEAIVLQNL